LAKGLDCLEKRKEDNLRVLIVDDFAELRELIGLYLSSFGMESDMAENGLIACEKAASGAYDVILMDIQMPRLNGIDAVRKLRAESYDKPVIALTAHTTTEDREEYIRSGFDDFLGKPFTIDELKQLLEKHSPRPLEA
jgi:two-component system, sensor histidine kinase